MMTRLALFLQSLFTLSYALTTSATYIWPNYVMDELEHLLVDGGGFNDAGVLKAITPCTHYAQGSQLIGAETAAAWIRAAFHDFINADVSAGKGGLDASLVFETTQPGNGEPDFTNTISFFAPYVNAHVSMADLIGLSVAVAIGGCSPSRAIMPFRGGRVDATEPGPPGIPAPSDGIKDTLNRMATAGLNQSDAIALTACGHTMGGVSHVSFPDIVPLDAATPTNLGGFSYFDTTTGVFDVNVVNEYLDGTGKKGGALVTTANVSMRSDLRLYSSDNNATMRRLGSSSESFISTCVDVLTRMINTVPYGVKLTDVIVPNVVKPVDISLTVDTSGNIVFSGYIRLLSSTLFSKDSVVTITGIPRDGSLGGSLNITTNLTQTGSGLLGTTNYYSFSAPVDPKSGISGFCISVTDSSKTTTFDNGGGGYPIQDNVIWLSQGTTITPSKGFIVTAVLTSLKPKGVNALVSVPTPQNGTMAPKIETFNLTLTQGKERGLYTIYTGSTNYAFFNQSSVDIVAVTQTGATVKDEFNKLTVISSPKCRGV